MKAQAQSAVTDIRRLVYALRPPALDDLGLIGAIGEPAAQYAQNGLRVSVHAPEELPPLPAAVEVAAYRIAQEAITNVVHHAAARECTVSLTPPAGGPGRRARSLPERGRGVRMASMRAGARGYLLKGADKEEMLLAIRAVSRGEAVFGPGIARRLIQYFSSPPQPARTPRSIFPEPTDREREILDLVAGRNNQEIAAELFLSLKTVRNYVSNTFTKLQVADRAQAIVRAGEAGQTVAERLLLCVRRIAWATPVEAPTSILAGMAKRGYTRDTIRGGASDWDVSRPFSSYLRMLGSILAHPVRFFEVLPKISDVRAPALFLAFSGLPTALLWFVAAGIYPALVALLLPLPISFPLAWFYHLGSAGGRYGYLVTWRTVAYPFGFSLPLSALPVVRWVAAAYAGVVLVGVGLAVVREIGAGRAVLTSAAITGLLLFAVYQVAAGWL